MGDNFAEMASSNLRHPPPMITLLDDSRIGPYNYPQDAPKSADEVEKAKVESFKSGTVPPQINEKPKQPGIVERSVVWPYLAYQNGSWVPFASALGAFALSPVVDPNLTYGAALAAAYGVGLVANCIILRMKPGPDSKQKKIILKKID